MNETTSAKHAGLLVPLDMFRISQLAAIFGELLVSKARNILDAKLVVSRHPLSGILLMRIEGSVVEGNPPEFWRENADLVALASRAIPRQVIMYYVEGGPERREGFMVAQQGQVLAADDATADRMPPEATEADWPVSRLCQQLKLSVDDLAQGFAGGPTVEVSLVEPTGDDQTMLMTLMGQDAEGGEAAPGAEAGPEGAAPPSPAAARATAAKKAEAEAEADAKRRAKEQAEEEAARRNRAQAVQSDLRFEIDEVGVVVAPKAELSEADVLGNFIVSKVEGDLPYGLPSNLADELQGKRVDIVVKVDFLSEVFVENNPLNKPQFQESSQTRTLGDKEVRVMEVLGPRLGYGTLISTGKAPHVFVSRKPGMPLPTKLITELLDS